jgi:hypothetical protein
MTKGGSSWYVCVGSTPALRLHARSHRVLASASCLERQDRSCDFPQIIVELVVATRQALDVSLRNRACVELDMRRRRNFIAKPVIEMDRDVFRKARTKLRRELQIVS